MHFYVSNDDAFKNVKSDNVCVIISKNYTFHNNIGKKIVVQQLNEAFITYWLCDIFISNEYNTANNLAWK